MEHRRPGHRRLVQEARPAADGQEPGNVRDHGGRGADHRRHLYLRAAERGFIAQLALWLWFTVLFANFAEAVAEGRGKAQADSLRKARKDTIARRLRDGREEKVPAPELQKGDLVVCEAGDTDPGRRRSGRRHRQRG